MNTPPLRGLNPDGSLVLIDASPGVQILARILPKFGGEIEAKANDDMIGNIYLHEGKIEVLLHDYYDVETIRATFGNIEFFALDYRPPGPGLDMDEALIKKFQIINWVMEGDN